jgi:hypothetical protein
MKRVNVMRDLYPVVARPKPIPAADLAVITVAFLATMTLMALVLFAGR